MKYYKINNLVQSNGDCNYKGLDITQINAGSQYYDIAGNNMCIVASNSNEDIPTNGDLTQLTEAEYIAEKARILAIPTPLSELEQLRANQTLMQQALDDLILNGGIA